MKLAKYLYNIRLTVSALALAGVAALAHAASKPQIFHPGNSGDYRVSALSDNGRYAIAQTAGNTDVDNPRPVGGVLIDLNTNKPVTIPAPTGWAGVNDVTDSGVVVGESGGKPGYWDPTTGRWTTFEVPANLAGGAFMSVTPDGSMAVGYYRDPSNEYFVSPMCFDLHTGTAVDLPNLPVNDLSGVDSRQNIFYAVSADGRYALGQMSQSYLAPVSMFSYIYDLQEKTWTPIGYDCTTTLVNGREVNNFTCTCPSLHFIMDQHFSCDGAWVTGAAYMVFDGGELSGGAEFRAPYRYNVAENRLEVYTAESERNLAGNKITADGVILAATAENPYATAYVRTDRFFVSLDQILEQVYGTSVAREIGGDVTGCFECLSADGKTAVMVSDDNCYVIRMDEPFKDAAMKVDLLANYTPSIPSGTALSRIGEIKLTFDRAVTCKNLPQTVALKRASDGTTVRQANTTAISASNDHEMVITFRTQTLDPDETYTVSIPAGYVALKDDASFKNKAIELTYVGRKDGPVTPVRVAPASGSPVAMFNPSTEVITVTFDARVAITDKASCLLYADGSDEPIAAFNAVCNGNAAVFYPTATWMLYRGSDYRVVIAAGSVTDVSGAGPNEEIVLEYQGSYRRQVSDSDIYLFSDHSESYDNFIFYQGPEMSRQQPAATVASWGFTIDNNAWQIVTSDEESADWAFVTHSMFETPATADSWLVVPQLLIPDDKTYLTFKTQGYLKSKSDRLKVIVYEDDAVYNYFTAELAERFVEHGTVLFDDVVLPGASEGSLAGDWTVVNRSLAPFAGKNVYIAFVNQNTDQSAIFIDDVAVGRDLDFFVANLTPERVVNGGSVMVRGEVTALSELKSFEGITVTLCNAEGATLASVVDPEFVLTADGDPFQFNFEMSLESGVVTPYTIKVTAGETTLAYNYTVTNLLFQPSRRVVLEEYTGSECGNCPYGILAIERLQERFPDNFIPVTIRTYQSDVYSTGLVGYSNFLGLNAAPTGRVDRGATLSPIESIGSEYFFNGRGRYNASGEEFHLWADAVEDELAAPSDAALTTTADFSGDLLTLNYTVNFAVRADERPMRVFAVLVEDRLPNYQVNYLSTSENPIFGEWRKGGIYGSSTVTSYVFNDVARYVLTGSNYGGQTLGEFNFEPGRDYNGEIAVRLPADRYNSIANCRVVTMLIDGSTGRVLNADSTDVVNLGVEEVEVDPADTAPEYYNLQGVRIDRPGPGVYIVRRGSHVTKELLR